MVQLITQIPNRNYYIHTGTSNESFLKTSDLLASKGIQNNKFMLSLFDPVLAEIDPLSPDLTDELKIRVLSEIIKSPWYFLREIIRVPISGGRIPYELHLGNLFLTWCMISNINSYLLLPRQNYKTISACAMYLWIYCFGTSNSHILFFNKELSDSQNNLKRVKDLMEEIPEWLKNEVLSDSINDRNAIEYIYSGHRNNRIEPKPPGRDLSHSEKLG
jgi:hypothetical protein